MRPGTPGFVGARLREAREARGLTIVSLAEMLGVSKQAVSQYEHNGQSPRPDIMRRLADVLNFPPQFFSAAQEPIETGAVFYRSLSAATKAARTRAEWRYKWARRIARYLEAFVKFPVSKFPDFSPPADPHALSDDHIESLALQARRFWGLGDGPISNVVWLLENHGAIVTRGYLNAETLDAFSEWCHAEGRGYIFLGADKGAAVRSRYDVAHELGHLLLHRNVDKTRLVNGPDYKLIENQAHKFAGAFMLPASTFSEDVYSVSLDSFRALKTKWKTSIAMMIMRSADLEFISDDQKRRLFVYYSHRGWRSQEPLDDELPLEQPRLAKKAFELIVNEGVQSRDAILAALPYAPGDIEELAGLPDGFFGQQEAPVSLRETTSQPTGTVIPFKPRHSRMDR